MLSSRLSKQLTATLAELDTARARANDFQNKWQGAEDALRREKARCRQTAEENLQLQDVISALRSLVADKTAVLEATRTKLEEEKRVTASLSEDHIRLMEETYSQMSTQPVASSMDSLADAESYHTARSSGTPSPGGGGGLHSDSRVSLGDMSFYSTYSTTSLRSSPSSACLGGGGGGRHSSSAAAAAGRQHLFELVSGRALIAVEMTRSDDAGLGFTFACQNVANLNDGGGTLTHVSATIANTPPPPPQGVFVRAVRTGSVAEKALVPGDEILELNNMFCRGIPHPVVAMKLKGLQGSVQLVVARQLHMCGMTAAPSGGAPLPVTPATSPAAVAAGEGMRAVLQEMLQELQYQLSEEQRQIREEIAVCNRSVVSVQIAVEDALNNARRDDLADIPTPTGSVENFTMTTDGPGSGDTSPALAHRKDPIGSSWSDEQVTPVARRGSQATVIRTSTGASPTERVYDEFLKTKQQLMDQVYANGDLQSGMAALRAECSGAVLRARQAESGAEESAKTLREAQALNTSQQETCAGMAKQLSIVTSQRSELAAELASSRDAAGAKDDTIAKLLDREKGLSAMLDDLRRERDDAKQALSTAACLRLENGRKDSDLESEKNSKLEWQTKAREAQEELFHVRAQLSASESQLSHWQIKEQQLQAQLAKLNERLNRTEEELADSKETTDRFEKQLRSDRQSHQDEVKTLTDQVCVAEMELQQFELQINQRDSRESDRESKALSNLSQLNEECEKLKQRQNETEAIAAEREDELRGCRQKLHQLESDCKRYETGLVTHAADSQQHTVTIQALTTEKDRLMAAMECTNNSSSQHKLRLEDSRRESAELADQLANATDLANATSLEKAQLQGDFDRRVQECAELKESLKSKTDEAARLSAEVNAVNKSREKSEDDLMEQGKTLSSLKTIQQKQGKEIGCLRADLDHGEELMRKSRIELDASAALSCQLKASVDNYQSRESATTRELDSQRQNARQMESELQLEVTRRQVLENELARLEKSFQSASEASKTMSSSSTGQLKSLDAQLREERQQLLQSRTECAETQTKLRTAEAKLGKLKSKMETLQNEASLLQQSAEMLKAACHDSNGKREANEKTIAELRQQVKNATTSLDATNDVASQLREIVEGNAQELSELRGTTSRQASELAAEAESLAKLQQSEEHLLKWKNEAGQELQRTKNQLVLAEDKLALAKEDASQALAAGQSSSDDCMDLQRRVADLEQRFERSKLAKANLETQLAEVLSSSGEQVRDLMKKVDYLTVEKTALEDCQEMTKSSLQERNRHVAEERDSLAAKLKATKDEAERLTAQAELARTSGNADQLKLSRLHTELELASSAAATSEAKLAKTEESLLELRSSSADLRGRFDAQKTFAADLQDELTRLQSEKKSLGKSLDGSTETIQELSAAVTELRSKLLEHDQSERLSSQRSGRFRQELEESRDAFAQLQSQLKEERSYVGKLREQSQATADANAQLKSAMELMMRQADSSSSDQHRAKERLTALQRELDDSRNQVDLFSASQAAVKENLTKVLKEREDLLLQLEQLKLSGHSSQQKLASAQSELDATRGSKANLEREIDELAKQISKMATLQVELFDAQTSVEQLRREASKHQDVIHALRTERDKLRDVVQLQESESLKHGHGHGAATPAGGGRSKAKLTPSSNKKELYAALTAADGEACRLQEYVEKMMTVVIERAPHLLEAISQR